MVQKFHVPLVSFDFYIHGITTDFTKAEMWENKNMVLEDKLKVKNLLLLKSLAGYQTKFVSPYGTHIGYDKTTPSPA